MSLEICNEDYVITITPNGAWIPGTPLYEIFKCTKLKVNSKFALIWHILWDIKNLDCVLPGHTFLGGGGMMFPTGTKCFTNGDNPMRKTDQATCSGTFQNIANPAIYVFCRCKYEITDAGQNKARCE